MFLWRLLACLSSCLELWHELAGMVVIAWRSVHWRRSHGWLVLSTPLSGISLKSVVCHVSSLSGRLCLHSPPPIDGAPVRSGHVDR